MPHWTTNLRWLIAAGALTLLTACGGGGGGGVANNPAADFGDVVVGVTDAEGDFVTYRVDVRSIRMEKANGDSVETMPLSTSIDFTELTELTELVTIATIPAGIYTHIGMTLDYTQAEITAQDANGNEVPVVPVDSAGVRLVEFDVRIKLADNDAVRIAPGVPAHVTLDFDLDASNTIDLDLARVTVEPFLLVVPEFDKDREHRVRGVLADVDAGASAIILKVRPFRHRSGNFGRFRFLVDAETWYEIDGVSYTGEDGLRAMAVLDENTPVVALGAHDRRFTATAVVAGSSVPWSDADVVRGVVTARVEDVLTVKNARVHIAGRGFGYRESITVQLDAETTVTALNVDGDLGKDAISVGQRIVALGDFSDDETLAADRVRMMMNQLTADVLAADPLVVDLYYLNGRRPDTFDFSGTGGIPEDDADPNRYEINTGTLALHTIQAGHLVRVRGLVNDFGAAPPDFNAQTVIDVDVDLAAAVLGVSWAHQGGTATPFTQVAADRVDVDLSEARHVLKLLGVPHDHVDTLDTIGLIAPGDGRGLYAVAVRGTGEVHLYRDFARLSAELINQLDAGNLMTRIAAHGRYNGGNQELTTPRASFEFKTP